MFSATFVSHISHCKKPQRDIINAHRSSRNVPGVLARYCQIINLEFSRQILKKFSNIKFRANPSSVSRYVPCGQTDVQTHTTKLTDAFRNFANAPKHSTFCYRIYVCFTLNKYRIISQTSLTQWCIMLI